MLFECMRLVSSACVDLFRPATVTVRTPPELAWPINPSLLTLGALLSVFPVPFLYGLYADDGLKQNLHAFPELLRTR